MLKTFDEALKYCLAYIPDGADPEADEPGQGGACHFYAIEGFNAFRNPSSKLDPTDDDGQEIIDGPCRLPVIFQNGPIKEFGVNGVTQEALAAIIIDRLRSFQNGPFACEANAMALGCFEEGLSHLQERTRARITRGVEGTHEK